MNLKRVIIVSENVSMQMGGEASLGFYYFKLMRARGMDVRVVCHARVRDELRGCFRDEDFGRFSFVEDTWLQASICRVGKVLPYRVRDLVVGQFIHWLRA